MSKTICCHICGNLGDSLLLTPVVEAIRQLHPESRIYCYGHNPQGLSLWEHNPHITGIISHPKEVLSADPKDYRRLVNRLDKTEVIISSSVCNRRFSLQEPRRHVLEVLCRLVGVDFSGQRIGVYLAPEDETFAEKTIAQFGPKLALMHTTSFSCRNKEWYPERWADVVKEAASWGYKVLQVGVAQEQPIVGAINLLGKTSIRQALALLKYADFFMGIDAVFNHATNAWGKPAVVLFGATSPDVWGYSHNINIYRGLKCQPCMDLLLNACQVRKCMQQIAVEEVIQAVNPKSSGLVMGESTFSPKIINISAS